MIGKRMKNGSLNLYQDLEINFFQSIMNQGRQNIFQTPKKNHHVKE